MIKKVQNTFKSAICVCLSAGIIVMTSGCGVAKKIANSVLDSTQLPTNLEISQEVLDYFENDSAEDLKELLCNKTKGIDGIDKQIQDGFDFFEGNVISFDENVLSSEEKSVDHGTTDELCRTLHIEDIKTDAGKTYKLIVDVNLIYLSDEDRKGITFILISDVDTDEDFKIGYSWPDHYLDGVQLSCKILHALGEDDSETLKDLMCEKVLEKSDIDKQIDAAFDFFEGEATMGRVDEDGIRYDGNHDFKSNVVDYEVIDGNEPIRTSVYVYSYNIETDADRIYKLEFYADLFNQYNEEYEGVSQITVLDEDDNKVVIGRSLSGTLTESTES